MKILYICTHNRCRSILSEALSNHIGEGKLVAKSAGSAPANEIHPLTLLHLKAHNIPTHALKSKSWETLETFSPDVVISLCDSAVNEACPVWMESSLVLHWGLEDPSKELSVNSEYAKADDDIKTKAFNATIAEIQERVIAMLAYDWESFDTAERKATLQKIMSKTSA